MGCKRKKYHEGQTDDRLHAVFLLIDNVRAHTHNHKTMAQDLKQTALKGTKIVDSVISSVKNVWMRDVCIVGIKESV